MRTTRCLTFLSVVLLAAVGWSPGDVSGADPAGASLWAVPAAALLAEYQPVTYLYRQDWKPVAVETVLSSALLERSSLSGWRIVGVDPTANSLPAFSKGFRLDIKGCTPARNLDTCYRNPAASAPPVAIVYGRAWANPVVSAPIQDVLEYWFFSYLDDWRNSLSKPTTWQIHGGDWEVDLVALGSDGAPLEVAYSQHDRGVVRPWANVPIAGGTHPLDYVALGSHANYFTVGRLGEPGTPHLIQPSFSGIPLAEPDFTSSQTSYGPAGLAQHPAQVVDISGGAAWLNLAGPWGDGNYLLIGSGSNDPNAYLHLRVGASPTGPALHDVWRNPLDAFRDWPADDGH